MDSINTNEMMHDKAKQEPKTWVWWDINSCPVPDGYDARMVGKCIESALKKAGYSGPLTITAIGNLSHTLRRTPDVLPTISSTGILLSHVPGGFRDIFEEFLRWTWRNPPPATLMLITDSGETSRHALEEKLCETGESPCRFFCQLCKFVGQSFEDFTTHLKSRDHLIIEVDMVVGPPPKRKLVKPTFNVSKYINKQTKKTLKDSNWEIEEERMSL